MTTDTETTEGYPLRSRRAEGPAHKVHEITLGSRQREQVDARLSIFEFDSFSSAGAYVEDGGTIGVMALDSGGYAVKFGDWFVVYLRQHQLGTLLVEAIRHAVTTDS